MNLTTALFNNAFNAMTTPVALLDTELTVMYTNDAWDAFEWTQEQVGHTHWNGANFLKTFLTLATDNSDGIAALMQGFTKIKRDAVAAFDAKFSYEKNSEQRWFNLQCSRFIHEGAFCYLLMKNDISTQQALQNENLKLARIDPLTNIANRRRFDEFLDYEWHHCRRHRQPISLAVIDIDGLKAINEQYGHDSGDSCLKSTARKLKQYTGRATDLCARLGSDEFVVLWGNTSRTQSLKLTHTLLSDINQVPVTSTEGSVVGNIEASIGLCTVTPTDNDFTSLVSTSDSLMYQAKQSGRNRINVRSQ